MATFGAFPFGAAHSGPWTSWPTAGSADADPYARAIIARQAATPLGNGEGLSFFAATDDALGAVQRLFRAADGRRADLGRADDTRRFRAVGANE